MQTPNLFTFEVKGQQMMQWLAWQLIEQSCWFQITPLPDDEWQVTIKNESGLRSAIQIIVERYQLFERPSIRLEMSPGMDALRVHFAFDQPEARGEVILETGVYGLHVIAPDVHAEQAVALLDLFWQSHAAAEIADEFGRKRKFHILLYSPDEREDPVGGIAYHPQSRLTLNWGMQEQPVTTVGEVAFELATQD